MWPQAGPLGLVSETQLGWGPASAQSRSNGGTEGGGEWILADIAEGSQTWTLPPAPHTRELPAA